jgi:hypothetical protein
VSAGRRRAFASATAATAEGAAGFNTGPSYACSRQANATVISSAASAAARIIVCMLFDVFMIDEYSRGPHPTQIPKQMSFQVEADSEEAAEVPAMERWEAKFGEGDRPTRIQIAPALRQP